MPGQLAREEVVEESTIELHRRCSTRQLGETRGAAAYSKFLRRPYRLWGR